MENAAATNEQPETALATVHRLTDLEVQAAQAGNKQEIVASDILIPRLLLMQGISPLVTSRKAQIGDMVRNTTGEKLGDPENPIDLVPIVMMNTWTDYEDTGNKPLYRGSYHRGVTKYATNGTPLETNNDLPWDFKGLNGESMFRQKTITLYALLPEDVKNYEAEFQKAIETGEAPDLNKTVMPVVITLQSTSFKYAGKKVASFFNDVKIAQSRFQGRAVVAPFQYVLTIGCREEKKGTNAWYVYDVLSRKSLVDPKADADTQAQQKTVREEAARWASHLATNTVRVDDSGEVAEDTTRTSGGAETLI